MNFDIEQFVTSQNFEDILLKSYYYNTSHHIKKFFCHDLFIHLWLWLTSVLSRPQTLLLLSLNTTACKLHKKHLRHLYSMTMYTLITMGWYNHLGLETGEVYTHLISNHLKTSVVVLLCIMFPLCFITLLARVAHAACPSKNLLYPKPRSFLFIVLFFIIMILYFT